MAEALAAAERAEKTAAARSEGGNGSKGSRARESHGRAETIRGSRAGPEPAPLSDFTQPEPPGRGDAGGKSGAVQGLEARLSQLQLPPSPGGGGEGGSGFSVCGLHSSGHDLRVQSSATHTAVHPAPSRRPQGIPLTRLTRAVASVCVCFSLSR